MSSLRYSQLYIDQPNPLPDSARARNRLAKLMERVTDRDTAYLLSGFLEAEVGVGVGVGRPSHSGSFCVDSTIRELLDAITLTHSLLPASRLAAAAGFWSDVAGRVFLA